MPTPNDEQLYLDATQEVDSGTQDPALWAKAMALAEGDEEKVRYRYIALRVEELTETPASAPPEDPSASIDSRNDVSRSKLDNSASQIPDQDLNFDPAGNKASAAPSAKPSLTRWIPIFLIATSVFVGARMCHPGGIRGLIGDKVTESSISPEMKMVHDEMLKSMVPVVAAMTCFKDHGETAELKEAMVSFNARNKSLMEGVIASIKAAGGMTEAEKDLVDREAQRKACALLGISFNNRLTSRYRSAHSASEMCEALARRINSGEFDLRNNLVHR